MHRDTFCSYCGTRFADSTTYPRTCTVCGAQVWANPIPVAVVLVPVVDGERTGLLVVRRTIPSRASEIEQWLDAVAATWSVLPTANAASLSALRHYLR